MRWSNRILAMALSGALSVSATQQALACAFHGYIPNSTLVDLLLETEQVIVARPSAPRSAKYSPVETLMGPNVTNIPIRVAPDMQARHFRNPEGTVLLMRDGSYGPWMEMAFLENGYREIIDHVMRHQSAWLLGRYEGRLRLFSQHLNDPNPDIRRLALREMDRAPYVALKRARIPDIQNLKQELETGQPDLMPIRILLAGLSKDRTYTPVLNDRLDVAVRRDTPYLSAYATALIELNGKSAVEDLTNRYLRTVQTPSDAQERLLQALALQYKSTRGATRRAITREVASLVREQPAYAEMVARQFGPQTSGRLLK